MPVLFWLCICSPALVIVARVVAAVAVRRRDRRPGYVDLTGRRL